MKRLNSDIINFFRNQGFAIVSTIDKSGYPHNACKGIVKINKSGRIYLLDLYRAKTYGNLKQNSRITITVIDEHRFTGYSLKGRAKIVLSEKFTPRIMRAWEERITSRITQRLLKNIREEKGHPRHPESLLPKPQYMIDMETEEVIDLTPHHLRKEGQ